MQAASSLASTGAGVAAGAITACQDVTTKSWMPHSAAVGTSGMVGLRAALVTISARSRPAAMCGATVPRFWKVICTSPAISAVAAAAPPW